MGVEKEGKRESLKKGKQERGEKKTAHPEKEEGWVVLRGHESEVSGVEW